MKTFYVISIIIVFSLLVGCRTVPMKIPFPSAPDELMEKPAKMYTMEVKDETPLSDFLSVVIWNYGKCHENAIRVSAWQSWYTQQKDLFSNFDIIMKDTK